MGKKGFATWAIVIYTREAIATEKVNLPLSKSADVSTGASVYKRKGLYIPPVIRINNMQTKASTRIILYPGVLFHFFRSGLVVIRTSAREYNPVSAIITEIGRGEYKAIRLLAAS